MPFIITTKRRLAGRTMVPTADAGPQPLGAERFEVVSRRAVATLEEAKVVAEDTLIAVAPAGLDADEGERLLVAITELSESGGSVGPLPDGEVIDVEAWSEIAFRVMCADRFISDFDMPLPDLIAAYNAKQAA